MRLLRGAGPLHGASPAPDSVRSGCSQRWRPPRPSGPARRLSGTSGGFARLFVGLARSGPAFHRPKSLPTILSNPQIRGFGDPCPSRTDGRRPLLYPLSYRPPDMPPLRSDQRPARCPVKDCRRPRAAVSQLPVARAGFGTAAWLPVLGWGGQDPCASHCAAHLRRPVYRRVPSASLARVHSAVLLRSDISSVSIGLGGLIDSCAKTAGAHGDNWEVFHPNYSLSQNSPLYYGQRF